jgi:hypothetical protein
MSIQGPVVLKAKSLGDFFEKNKTRFANQEEAKKYIIDNGNVVIRITKGDPDFTLGLKKGAKCRLPGAPAGVEATVGADSSGFDSYQEVVEAYNTLQPEQRCLDSRDIDIALKTEDLQHRDRRTEEIISNTYQTELDNGQISLDPGTICLNHGQGRTSCKNSGPKYGLKYAEAAPAPVAAVAVSWYPDLPYPAPRLNDDDKKDIDRVLLNFVYTLGTLPTENIEKINNAIRKKIIRDGSAVYAKQYDLKVQYYRGHLHKNWKTFFTTDTLLWGLYVFTHTESQVNKRIADAGGDLPFQNKPEAEDDYWKPFEEEGGVGESSKRLRTETPQTQPPLPPPDESGDPFLGLVDQSAGRDDALQLPPEQFPNFDEAMQGDIDFSNRKDIGIRKALGMLSI